MTKNFFQRLRNYYQDVAAVLRGEAKPASIFPNSTDVGISREQIYAKFLRQHAPSKCNVFFGGFIFGNDGSESKQLDVIITTDTTPNFNFYNQDGSGKSFSPIEGTLGVVSIKSMLNKSEIEDVLTGIASIPPTSSLEGRVNILLNIPNYDDWPYKIAYSSDGISGETLLTHINDYYCRHPNIPHTRRPNLIHVAGKYIIVRALSGMSIWNKHTQKSETPPLGTFCLFTTDSDVQGIIWALDGLQTNATASTHILFNYRELINQINGVTNPMP